VSVICYREYKEWSGKEKGKEKRGKKTKKEDEEKEKTGVKERE